MRIETINEDLELHGLSVVVPCFDEEDSILTIIADLKVIKEKVTLPMEIVIVNDGSTDNTKRLLGKVVGARVLSHEKNRGYGAAIKTGLRESVYSLVAICDSDNELSVGHITEMLNNMKDHDMISGHRTNSFSNISFLRLCIKSFMNIFASFLSGTYIPDLNCGLRIMKKNIVMKYLHLLPDKFSLTTSITLIMIFNGYKLCFFPLGYKRKTIKSNFKLSDFLSMFWAILKLNFKFNTLRFCLLSFAILTIVLILSLIKL